MHVRRFGRTELELSEIGLGCARIGGIFQKDTHGFLNLLAAARERGINFFDTADMYSQGESEALVGRAFQNVRSRVVIASKAGYCLPARRKIAARFKPILRPLIRVMRLRRERLSAAARGVVAQDFSPPYLQRAVEGSLRRLRTDYLDLFQLHSPPAEVVEQGRWQPALESLQRAGKIRYYGISCDTVEAALAALRFPGVSSLQVTVNLLDRRYVDSVLPLAKAQGVAGIARECLANGLLVKDAGDVDLAAYWPSADEQAAKGAELARHRAHAASQGVPLARIALDDVRGLPGVDVALVGARSVGQLDSLLAAISGTRPQDSPTRHPSSP